MKCFHLFVDGFGSMGDALTCCKCGLSKYPEALSIRSRTIAALPGRTIREGHPQYEQYVREAQAAMRKRDRGAS